MPLFVDARIPVRFGALPAGTADLALLVEGEVPVPSKVPVVRFVLPSAEPRPAGCLCCTPRSPVADALGRLFLARARGETPFFRLVVAITEDARGRAAICSALEQDAFVSARYRLEPP